MLQLPVIFSDHMVLQRQKNIAVWGETDASKVNVSIGDNHVSVCPQNGTFDALLPPMQAGGPYVMRIEADQECITFEDVMIGEVWLAGGQSNMELELQNSLHGKEVVASLHNEAVRFYYTPKIPYVGEKLFEAEKECSWEICTPQTAGRWSAVGYYFAEMLSQKLGVTVGVIGCNWGGTSASCWMSREALESNASIKSYVDEYDEIVQNQDEEEYIKAREAYLVFQAEFDKNVGLYYQTAENPTWEEAQELYGQNQYPGPMGPRTETRPYGLYESMLMRVCPYTLRGFIYYQGEEDDHKPYTYYDLLTTLIRQWRKDWNDENLAFMLVQLPMFQNGGGEPDYQNWPFIREAQMRVYQTIKNTGIAVILDHGEFENIHPTRKDVVGYRLADQALLHTYGREMGQEIFGPIYRDYYIDGSKMVLCFEHAEEGIHCTEDEIIGFEIAGKDQKYYPAKAEIDNDRIVIMSDKVPQPVYARFQWTNYREVTLFGANQMPVAPFRTSRLDGAVATGSRNCGEFSMHLPVEII